MKEIDLLPEWYKKGQRQQVGYRTQYIVLGGVFVVMVVWNFIFAYSVSKAEAKIAQAESKAAVIGSDAQEFDEIKNEVKQLQIKADVLKEVDSRINVASVVAELSFLINKKIVLSKVEFIAERFYSEERIKGRNRSVVRTAVGKSGGREQRFLGDVRFRVVIRGVAADAGDVAELICKLEDSPYFCLVYPSYSRNAQVKAGTRNTTEDYEASEFEIGCYLANYQQESLAKK